MAVIESDSLVAQVSQPGQWRQQYRDPSRHRTMAEIMDRLHRGELRARDDPPSCDHAHLRTLSAAINRRCHCRRDLCCRGRHYCPWSACGVPVRHVLQLHGGHDGCRCRSRRRQQQTHHLAGRCLSLSELSHNGGLRSVLVCGLLNLMFLGGNPMACFLANFFVF